MRTATAPHISSLIGAVFSVGNYVPVLEPLVRWGYDLTPTKRRLGPAVVDYNYGIITIDWSHAPPLLSAEVHVAGGRTALNITAPLTHFITSLLPSSSASSSSPDMSPLLTDSSSLHTILEDCTHTRMLRYGSRVCMTVPAP